MKQRECVPYGKKHREPYKPERYGNGGDLVVEKICRVPKNCNKRYKKKCPARLAFRVIQKNNKTQDCGGSCRHTDKKEINVESKSHKYIEVEPLYYSIVDNWRFARGMRAWFSPISDTEHERNDFSLWNYGDCRGFSICGVDEFDVGGKKYTGVTCHNSLVQEKYSGNQVAA